MDVFELLDLGGTATSTDSQLTTPTNFLMRKKQCNQEHVQAIDSGLRGIKEFSKLYNESAQDQLVAVISVALDDVIPVQAIMVLIAKFIFPNKKTKPDFMFAQLDFNSTNLRHILALGTGVVDDQPENGYEHLRNLPSSDFKNVLKRLDQRCVRVCGNPCIGVELCGQTRLKSALNILVCIGLRTRELFKADYRQDNSNKALEIKTKLLGLVQELRNKWSEENIVDDAAGQRLEDAVAHFDLSPVKVEASTRAIKGEETRLFCKQDAPVLSAAVRFARYLTDDNKKGYNALRNHFFIVFRWVEKVINLMLAFTRYDAMLVPFTCTFPVFIMKPTCPSKFFLASMVGYFFPVLARAGQELQDEVAAVRNHAWALFPEVLEDSFTLYKDTYLRENMPQTPKWQTVGDACEQAGAQRNFSHALTETIAEIDRILLATSLPSSGSAGPSPSSSSGAPQCACTSPAAAKAHFVTSKPSHSESNLSNASSSSSSSSSSSHNSNDSAKTVTDAAVEVPPKKKCDGGLGSLK